MKSTFTQIANDRFTEVYLGKLGELTLKGSNLKFFEKLLLKNVRTALETVDCHAFLQTGRLYISCTPASCPAVEYCLSHLLGITGWAKVKAVGKTIEEISQAVLELGKKAAEKGARTFKVEAVREDKKFPLNSYDICRQAAGPIYDSGLMGVDLHNPDVVIKVEVRDRAYVYSSQEKAFRGLPVGCSGKGLLLLSGGLDSPVAGFKMMGRGMKVECVYFHSYPYTSEEAQKKVEDLASIIADYGMDTHLNVISFTDIQMKIRQKAPEAWSTLMLRICMMKAANLLANRIDAQCIITGESLAQVASQTMENMAVTQHYAEKMLLRPLVGTDKEDIVNTALAIGTYGTSILPYQDCCVLFSPKHPVLRADLQEAIQIYESLEVDDMIQKAFDERQIIRFTIRDKIGRQWATKEYRPTDGIVPKEEGE